eukprot:sb/3467823/
MKRYLVVLLVILILFCNDVEGAKKKKKKKKKEKVTFVAERIMDNLWENGGYVYEHDELFDPITDTFMRPVYDEGDLQASDVWGNFDATLEKIHNSGAAVAFFSNTEYVTTPDTYFVGYVNTQNRAIFPPAIKTAQCTLDLCYTTYDFLNRKFCIDSEEIVEPFQDTELGRIQDEFLTSYQGLDEVASSADKVLCSDEFISVLAPTVVQHVTENSARVDGLMKNPKMYDGYGAGKVLPMAMDSISAQIMLKVVEKLCGISVQHTCVLLAKRTCCYLLCSKRWL